MQHCINLYTPEEVGSAASGAGAGAGVNGGADAVTGTGTGESVMVLTGSSGIVGTFIVIPDLKSRYDNRSFIRRPARKKY